MKISVSPAQSADDTFLLEVYACTRTVELGLVPWTDEQKTAFLRHQFEAQRQHYRSYYKAAVDSVISMDDTRVGRIYQIAENGLLKILDLIVLPDFRRRGIGSTIVRELLSRARNEGWRVQVNCDDYNPSTEFFAKFGFDIVEDNGLNKLLEWDLAAQNRVASTAGMLCEA